MILLQIYNDNMIDSISESVSMWMREWPRGDWMECMQNNKLVVIRANEEIAEHGSISAAIAAIERQIVSEDSVAAERAFMRKVRNHLLNVANRNFYNQKVGEIS